MGAAPLRRMLVQEDADVAMEVSVPEPSWEDFHAPMEEAWPEWWCDDCGTHNDGWRIPCAMCGTVREDVDGCE